MKPYILNYSETLTIIQSTSNFDDKLQLSNNNPTVKTLSIEPDTGDSLSLLDSTSITERTEPSDDDSINIHTNDTYCSTLITRSLEDDDPDNIDSTLFTESIESSDEDQALTSCTTILTKSLESQDHDDLILN